MKIIIFPTGTRKYRKYLDEYELINLVDSSTYASVLVDPEHKLFICKTFINFCLYAMKTALRSSTFNVTCNVIIIPQKSSSTIF